MKQLNQTDEKRFYFNRNWLPLQSLHACTEWYGITHFSVGKQQLLLLTNP